MPIPNPRIPPQKPDRSNSFCFPLAKEDAQECARKRKKNTYVVVLASTAMGACFFFLFKHPIPAIIIWTIAGILLILTQCHPRFLHAWHSFLMRFSEWLATGLSWLLLTPFYLLVFVPVRGIRRFTSKNELNLKPDPEAESYWNPFQESSNRERYRRQS